MKSVSSFQFPVSSFKFLFLVLILLGGCSAIRSSGQGASQSQLAKVYREIGNVNAELRSLYTVLREIREQQGVDYKKFHEDNSAAREKIRKSMASIRADLATYKVNQADVVNNIDTLLEKTGHITAKIEEYAYKVSSVAQRLDSIDARITQLSDIYRAASEMETGRVKGEERREKEKRRHWNTLGSGIVAIQTDISQLKVKVFTLQEDISTLLSGTPRKEGRKKMVLSRPAVLSPPVKTKPPLTGAVVPSDRKDASLHPLPLVSNRPEDIYQDAKLDYLKGNFTLAIVGFQSYIDKYPDSELAPNAQYWVGECYYGEGNYQEAIDSFAAVLTRYPKSHKIPSVMLKIAYSQFNLNKSEEAVEQLKKLITAYPGSGEAKLARERINSESED